MSSAEVSLWWLHVHLLVHLLKLLGLSLRDVQSHGQVIVVLDQLLNCACTVCKVMAQILTLFSQLLNNLRDLNTVHGSLTQLIIFSQEISIDTLKLLNVLGKLCNHLICSFKLLEKSHVLIFLGIALPSEESSKQSLQVIILAESNRQLLTSNVMTKQILPLNRELINSLIHSLES